jgi:L-lactate dehydrogenase
MNKGRKIAILGAGNVGATIAFALTTAGLATEIALIDIMADKAKGEAMDIIQGTPFCPPVDIYSGDYSAAEGADIVILTAGAARKPGQTRIDLAQGNINIVNMIMPEVVKRAPDAIYIVVANPVDILTYHITKNFGLKENQVIGSGTMLDSARLRSILAAHVDINPNNVHGYVFGEHGDTSMVPWSLTYIGGMTMEEFCKSSSEDAERCGKEQLDSILDDVRTSGGKVIKLKGATFFAVSLAVRRIVECIVQDANSVLTVSGLINGRYGIDDVCLSLPFVIGANGIEREITPPLTNEELTQLHDSADALKEVIRSVNFKPAPKA